jgi:hypothetical protein
MPDSEKVKLFIELAKTNQENLWKRRGIEWKVNFGFWTALGVIAGFSCERGLGSTIAQHHSLTLGVLFALWIVHSWYNLRIVRSNDKDLDWFIYYLSRAEKELTGENVEKKRPDPGKTGKWHAVLCPAVITFTLLLMLWLIGSGVIRVGQQSERSATTTSANPPQLLDKRPVAGQPSP